jgi:1-phosphofructokinase
VAEKRNDAPRLAVIAPSPIVTVTVEQVTAGHPEIHFHPGGQGFWVARMAACLGAKVVVCAPIGGESGRVLQALLAADGIELRGVPSEAPNGAYVHDRRSGERVELAAVPSPPLSRHEEDELYGIAVTAGLECGVMLLTGSDPADVVPQDLYGRLAADLRGNGCRVLADLTGPALKGALAGGLDLAKLSDEELTAQGWADVPDLDGLRHAAERLRGAGADNVLITRAAQGALVLAGGDLLELEGPRFTALDRHGTGDSMFAALGVAVARGMDFRDALRLAGAAGALNATRHGLGSGSRREVQSLSSEVQIRPSTAGA